MPLIATSESKELMLEIILNKTNSSGDRKLKLFVNNIVPTINTQISSIVECSSTGYEGKSLQGPLWQISTTNGITTASYPQQIFEINQEVLIYGYYVTNSAGTRIFWVERFDGAPYSLPSGGGSLGVELNFTLN